MDFYAQYVERMLAAMDAARESGDDTELQRLIEKWDADHLAAYERLLLSPRTEV